MARRANRREWVKRLDPVKYDRTEDGEQDKLEQMSLGGVLLTLSGITHLQEYELCRKVAEHLTGRAYEPEDVAAR